MKLMFITDAWFPQVNGVVTTMSTVINYLRTQGHEVKVIEPSQFYTVPCPTYPEIRLSVNTWKVGKMIEKFKADKIHIVSEGSLGLAAMIYLRKRGLDYTTAFHTKFPEYANARLPFLTLQFGYGVMHAFHHKSKRVMVATDGIRKELADWGISNGVTWSRGVDTTVFKPLEDGDKDPLAHLQGKKYLYVGRVATEKNISAFLDLDLPGHKIVVGDGPMRAELEAAYPDAHFVGYQKGRDLARYYAASDVMVFPSLTDTFGVVMLEAMACGTPVAAFPVNGPIDVIQDGVTGCMHDNLKQAVLDCGKLNVQDCIDHANNNDWRNTAEFLFNNMVSAGWEQRDDLVPQGTKPTSLVQKVVGNYIQLPMR